MNYNFNMSLIEIWNKVKRPFIAKDIHGWLVMIKMDPNLQIKKYYGKIYGKINRNLDMLYLSPNTRKIDKADFKRWELVEIIQEDIH